MIRSRLTQPRFGDAARCNSDGHDAKLPPDIRLFHAVADDEGVLGVIAALDQKLRKPLEFVGGVKDRGAVAVIRRNMTEKLCDLQPLKLRLDFVREVIAENNTRNPLRLKPLQKRARPAPCADIRRESFVARLEDRIRLFLGGQNTVDIAAVALVIMNDREIESFPLPLEGNRRLAVKLKTGVGSDPSHPRIGDQSAVPVEDRESIQAHSTDSSGGARFSPASAGLTCSVGLTC